MNLIEESFLDKQEKKKRRTTGIILAAIILVIVIIIAIIGYLMYIKSTILRLTIDGQSNEKMKELLVFEENGIIYAPIKEIAPYFGYDSYNGEYSEKSEIQSKCYVESENEVANFELGQNKIYKLDLAEDDENYEYVYIKNPVKAINGVLYVSTEGLEKAFNISFEYDQEKNVINIFTMPYLYEYYSSVVLDHGYTELNDEFVNQKSILKEQLIVEKNNQYGVIKTDGTTLLEPKYDSIMYLTNTGDYLVETNEKFGILSPTGETKVQIMYDSIELMDSDTGLYVAEKDEKYGVIDSKGNIKIYIENDEVGMDVTNFLANNIKNKYILAENLIPVQKGELWALYDKNGKQLTEFKYDSFGYIASNNRDAINLLVIPNYNVLVACKDEKYALINSSGAELFGTVADDIYMEISGGEKHYYIGVNDEKMDAEDWLKKNGITNDSNNQTKNSNNNSTNNNSIVENDDANSNITEENE